MKIVKIILISIAIVLCFFGCDSPTPSIGSVSSSNESTNESTSEITQDPVDWASFRYPWHDGLHEYDGFRIPAEELSIRNFYDIIPDVTTVQELFEKVGLPHGYLPTSFLWQYYMTKEGWSVWIAFGKNDTVNGKVIKGDENIQLEDIKTIDPDTDYELPNDMKYMWFSYTGKRIPSQELSISDFPQFSSNDDNTQQLFDTVGLPHGQTKEGNTSYYVYITKELNTVWVDHFSCNIFIRGNDGSLTALSDFVI